MSAFSLRLHVAESLPWVDSAHRVRSPFDAFRILDASSRRSLTENQRAATLWEFGVLQESRSHPDSAKPMLVDEEAGRAITVYPLGYEDAPHYREALQHLWISFFEWIQTTWGSGFFLLSDEVWRDSGGWANLGTALDEGHFGPSDLTLLQTRRSGVYFANLTQTQIDWLLRRWWPSPMGGIAGVVARASHHVRILERLRVSGYLCAEDLPDIAAVFETTPVFDNLGFVILSYGEPWEAIRRALAHQGWTDGAQLNASPS